MIKLEKKCLFGNERQDVKHDWTPFYFQLKTTTESASFLSGRGQSLWNLAMKYEVARARARRHKMRQINR